MYLNDNLKKLCLLSIFYTDNYHLSRYYKILRKFRKFKNKIYQACYKN